MKTITNQRGTKAVNISKDGSGTISAMYVDIYNGGQQVLEAKSFANENNAEKWASKKLS